MSSDFLKKRDDESEYEYHKRIVYGKLVDRTLSDYDYSELSRYVYGKEYSSDVARRLMYGSKYTMELMDRECIDSISNTDLIADVDKKMAELRKEQQRFYDQRREYNKLIVEDGRAEHLYNMLAQAAQNLDTTIGTLYTGPNLQVTQRDGGDAVLVFSDWHYGMNADNIFNAYNTKICIERVNKVVQDAIDRILRHRCRKLHIVVLGDLFHGAIMTSARVAAEELVCDQIMQVSEILAQSIAKLNNYVDETIVYMTYGNHGRTVANKKDSIHRDNLERLIPWWLEQRFYGVNGITVTQTDNEFLFIDTVGHSICATHGDLDSVHSSPRLIGTLLQKKCGKDVEYILLGDKHHHESFDELGITATICGSLCGTDDYANGKRLYSTPSQLLLIVTPEDGVDAEYRIKCE